MADTDATNAERRAISPKRTGSTSRAAGAARRARTRLERHLEPGCASLRADRPASGERCSTSPRQRASAYAPPGCGAPPGRGRTSRSRAGPGLARAVAEQAAILSSTACGSRCPPACAPPGPSPRQLLYKAGTYIVRLRVEPVRRRGPRVHRGTGRRRARPRARRSQDLAVLALHGPDDAGPDVDEPLGEFLLEPEAAENLRLSVGVAGSGPSPCGCASGDGTADGGRESARRAGSQDGEGAAVDSATETLSGGESMRSRGLVWVVLAAFARRPWRRRPPRPTGDKIVRTRPGRLGADVINTVCNIARAAAWCGRWTPRPGEIADRARSSWCAASSTTS